MPFQFFVTPEQSGQRLDKFLGVECSEFSRVRLQGFIRDGHALVNQVIAKPSYPLRAGDEIVFQVPHETAPSPLAAQDIPINFIFEDETLIVLNKPAGLVVHPGAGNREGTLANGLLHHCGALEIVGGEGRPGIVHRLDKETSGCLVVAKTEAAHNSLSAQFASREVEKSYLALCDGIPRMPHGKIDASIGRHGVHRQKMAVVDRGRDALTHYRVLGNRDGKSLIECRPRTGRTHQIRVHLKHLGHPVTGDPQYGRRGTCERHFLHAWKLGFKHPATGKRVNFAATLSPDFPEWALDAARAREADRMEKFA